MNGLVKITKEWEDITNLDIIGVNSTINKVIIMPNTQYWFRCASTFSSISIYKGDTKPDADDNYIGYNIKSNQIGSFIVGENEKIFIKGNSDIIITKNMKISVPFINAIVI